MLSVLVFLLFALASNKVAKDWTQVVYGSEARWLPKQDNNLASLSAVEPTIFHYGKVIEHVFPVEVCTSFLMFQ